MHMLGHNSQSLTNHTSVIPPLPCIIAAVSILARHRADKTVGGAVVKPHVGFPTIVNSASQSNLHFDWPLTKEAIRKLPKSCQKLCPSGNDQKHSTVKLSFWSVRFDTMTPLCALT